MCSKCLRGNISNLLGSKRHHDKSWNGADVFHLTVSVQGEWSDPWRGVNEALGSAFLCSWLCSQPPPGHSFWPAVMFSPRSPCSVWVADVVLSTGGQSPLLQREETSSFPDTAAVVGRVGAELGSSHTTAGHAELRAQAGAAPRGSWLTGGTRILGGEGHCSHPWQYWRWVRQRDVGTHQVLHLQLLVKSKGSEIKREILGRVLVMMPVPESSQLWGSLKVLILCLCSHKNKNYLFPMKGLTVKQMESRSITAQC